MYHVQHLFNVRFVHDNEFTAWYNDAIIRVDRDNVIPPFVTSMINQVLDDDVPVPQSTNGVTTENATGLSMKSFAFISMEDAK